MASGRVLATLQALSRLPSPGPAPAFTQVHVAQAVLIIGDEAPIGRIELSRRLGVGEGAIRTIIKHLTQAKIIAIARGGCELTKRGTLLYRSLRSRVSQTRAVDGRQLALDKACAAVLVRRSGAQLKRGIEQRDAAIRAGATGACSLIFRGHEFLMPMSEDEEWKLNRDDPLFRDLRDSFDAIENDVIVVSSGPDSGSAERGAMAAALTLLA